MSVPIQRASSLLKQVIGQVAFNPIVTASLLWLLTRAPVGLRSQLTSRIKALRNPHKFIRIVKALKIALVVGVLRVGNRGLNQ